MKYSYYLLLPIMFFLFCCTDDKIIEDALEDENTITDSSDVELINNPNDSITQNIIYVYNHDYVYNSYNNDFMNFEIKMGDIGTNERPIEHYNSDGSVYYEIEYTTGIVFNATGVRKVKNQYNQIKTEYMDISIVATVEHADSSFFGEFVIDRQKCRVGIATYFFYTDPEHKTQAHSFFSFASGTVMNISESKDKGFYTFTIKQGKAHYMSGSNTFNIDIRYKGKYN